MVLISVRDLVSVAVNVCVSTSSPLRAIQALSLMRLKALPASTHLPGSRAICTLTVLVTVAPHFLMLRSQLGRHSKIPQTQRLKQQPIVSLGLEARSPDQHAGGFPVKLSSWLAHSRLVLTRPFSPSPHPWVCGERE